MSKKFLFVLFFLSINVFGSSFFHTSTSAFLYGPGFVATTENISSMNINPAGLYRILYTELLMNFNSSYSFNYIGFGHFFKHFGNIGLSFFNDNENNNETCTFGYGSKIWKFLIFGFNIQYLYNSEMHELSFNPGLLLYFKPKKTLRKLSFGFSTANWLNRERIPEYNMAVSMTFKKRFSRTFIYTLGSSFDKNFHHKFYTFNTEFELFRYFFVNLGIRNDAIIIGNSLKRKEDALYAGINVNYVDSTIESSVSYRRLISKPYKSILKKKPKYRTKKKGSRKTTKNVSSHHKTSFEATDEEKLQQRELLEEGISLYSNDKLYEALKKWNRVVDINDSNEYAEQAQVYINLVTNELKSIKRK